MTSLSVSPNKKMGGKTSRNQPTRRKKRRQTKTKSRPGPREEDEDVTVTQGAKNKNERQLEAEGGASLHWDRLTSAGDYSSAGSPPPSQKK